MRTFTHEGVIFFTALVYCDDCGKSFDPTNESDELCDDCAVYTYTTEWVLLSTLPESIYNYARVQVFDRNKERWRELFATACGKNGNGIKPEFLFTDSERSAIDFAFAKGRVGWWVRAKDFREGKMRSHG